MAATALDKHPLIRLLSGYPEYERLRCALASGGGPVSVFGLGEAQKAHVMAALAADTGRCVLSVCANDVSAARLCEEALRFGVNAAHLPAREMPLMTVGYTASAGITSARLRALNGLCQGESMLVTASVAALMQRLAPPEVLIEASRRLRTGDTCDPVELVRALVLSGYERVDLCEGRGQVCLRGGYVDVYPMTGENPCRIEFFGDEIDTMREYDPLTQRSVNNVDELMITPATEVPLTAKARERAMALMAGRERLKEQLEELCSGGGMQNPASLLPLFYEEGARLLDYLPNDALILIDEPARIEESAKAAHVEFMEGFSAALERGEAEAEQGALLYSPLDTIDSLATPGTAMLFALTRSYSLITPRELFKFESRPATRYLAAEDMLVSDIEAWRKAGATVLIYAGTHAMRLHDRLSDMDVLLPVTETLGRDIARGEALIIGETLERGFEYPELRLCVITEAELYGGTVKRRAAAKRKRPQLAFAELSVGDLVVHELHGVGRFTGVETLTVAGVSRDYINLVYSGGDKLYIPTDQLDRVQKYVGGGEDGAKLSQLGSGEWQKTLSRTRESVKRLAFDLVKLYGERQKLEGFKFSPDTPWQKRLEENFPYEETPDQLTSIEEIKKDMESGRVMDRLLCGDVGYGKTEVALRVAFKAVMDGKQAAFLVPTTILAQQHYSTLVSRFSGFPVNVELLSRFNTGAEEKAVLKRLATGETDVVVGTHKLLGNNVRFHDLGLLIIDEEQRFGVGHKEQLKNLKKRVDVLSLSATPIPRTLHMSMTGIRDMSVIETPPEQRYPVQTYVMEYSETVAREAILKELGRGGQAYFVYNNVRGMELFAQKLRELVPEARIAHAHGQMSERMLEKTMLDFMEGQYDVLLCSTIIESGLDISNVNTMIVYDADRMGLSQLYQLRGRVGRGARLGYAYLTFRRDKVLSEIAEKRLTAIREFTQFGSGFKIAMRDLEIRGAGNMLGPEQHGHMAAVGYDLYCKLIDGAVREARGEAPVRDIDPVIEIPLSASIPHTYMPRENDRLSMYKRIAMIEDDDDVLDVRDELIDRFGELPEEVNNLIFVARLKADAKAAYVLRLMIREGELRMDFEPEAPIDLVKLYTLIKNTGGAQLTGGEKPSLTVRRKKAPLSDMCAELPQFIHTLKDCIEA